MEITDDEAVRRTLAGDDGAFGELVEAYAPLLLALARSRLRNEAEAEDAVQDAFVQAYRKLGTLRRPARFGAWLREILRNICTARWRERACHRRHFDILREERDHADRLEPPDRLAAEERHARLRREVEDLTPALREVILLRFVAGASRPDTAALLGVSLAAVDKRLERALGELRDRLEE
jgi:RNA polymerase sigma-70 factor (ECF subfamily)